MRNLRWTLEALALGCALALSAGCEADKAQCEGAACDPGDASVATPADGGAEAAASADAGADAAADAAAQPSLGVITAVELHAALANKDFLMIDVHIPRAGVVPGTDTSIPFNDVPALVQYIGPDVDKKVVLTCRSDAMSGSAGDALATRGYRNVRHLRGGMNAWTAAGYSLDP